MKELRCIVFTDRELAQAVVLRRRKLNDPLPDGELSGLKLSMGDGGLTARFLYDGGQTVLDVSESEVLAALVSYCMGKKVPLPAEADKTVYLIKGRVTLMITMNFNRPARLVTGSTADPEAESA